VSALVAVLIIGKRLGYGTTPTPPHNLPFTVLGASLLWFGWFGFNAGSALAANGLAVSAFVVTHTAAAAAALSWMLSEWIGKGKPTVLGAASGAVAGLVAITPGSGYVGPIAAIAIGGAAGVLCYGACMIKSRFSYDDSLDVVGVHGVGGVWGALATGIFAPNGSLGAQFIAVGATVLFAGAGTAGILYAMKAVMSLRVSAEEESMGLDLSQHSESAYVFGTDYDEAQPRWIETKPLTLSKPVTEEN